MRMVIIVVGEILQTEAAALARAAVEALIAPGRFMIAFYLT
jgi:hypothetical protein